MGGSGSIWNGVRKMRLIDADDLIKAFEALDLMSGKIEAKE